MLSQTQLHSLRRTAPAPNRLSAAMAAAGLVQTDVAEATGYTQSYISRIAAGRAERLPVETARAFARLFGCAIEDLFPATPETVSRRRAGRPRKSRRETHRERVTA